MKRYIFMQMRPQKAQFIRSTLRRFSDAANDKVAPTKLKDVEVDLRVLTFVRDNHLGRQRRGRFSSLQALKKAAEARNSSNISRQQSPQPKLGRLKRQFLSFDKQSNSDAAFLGRCTFVKAASSRDEFLKSCDTEFCFAGRSNVGKSALINALLRQYKAQVKDKPVSLLNSNVLLSLV